MKVILPGSYDPVTKGHLEIIKRAAEAYDEVFVVAFINPSKKYRFSVEDRVRMLALATDELDNVIVSYSTGLVVDYMREHGIEKIIKGYRTEADLSWEREQAEWNLSHGGYETELWRCESGFEAISSTAVRDALDGGDDGTVSALVPESVLRYIKEIENR